MIHQPKYPGKKHFHPDRDMKIRISFLAIFLLLLSLKVLPQFYNTGQAPASVKWFQINTQNFQIIYPDGFYKEANRITNLLEYMYEYVSADYQVHPEKISIILYNQSVISNGYVAWAPSRSEWITTPPEENYCEDWLEQLAIHEFRHVVQMNNLEQGMTKLLNLIFGEAATGAVAAYLPLWFLEGDAVASETMFSSSGRGRVSDFDRDVRAIELDRKKRLTYDQSYLGSYKYYIPDYYIYGYHMVSYSKLKFNTNIWRNTITQVARNPYLIAPFYFALKRNGCISKTSLYQQTLDSLKILWNNNLDTTISTDNLLDYPVQGKYYTNYRFVQPLKDNLFAVRSGIDDITRFVIWNDTTEILIHTPGQYNNTRISISDRYIAWEEVVSDVRWAQRNYSVIKLFDLHDHRVRTLRSKTRWFSPQLSPKNDTLMCLEIGLDNHYSLVFFDISSDSVIENIPLEGMSSVFCPVWIADDKIAFIALDLTGKKIMDYTIEKDSFSVLYNSGFINIDNLSVGDNKLYFSYDYQMTRSIFTLDLVTRNVYHIIHTRHGADMPYYNFNDQTLYYSDYTLNGYRPASILIDSSQLTSLDEVPKYNYPWIPSSLTQKNFNVQESDVPQKEYIFKPYSRLFHSFNFHSWFPFYADLMNFTTLYSDIYPGITLFSQNKLSTLTAQISYFYKDHKHYFEPRFIFEGLFPVFEINALFSNRSDYYVWPENLPKPADLHPYYSIALRAYLPLQLTRNKYHKYICPEINYGYINRYFYTRELGIKRGYNYLEASIFASSLLKQSHRDIQPRMGQMLFLTFNQPLIHPDVFTNAITGSLILYLPGIFRHHGIRFTISYEEHEKNKVPIMNNRISLPRGYDPDLYYYRNIRSIFEYTFPVIYPDLSIGPCAYIKRIHSTLYCDAAKILFPERINNSIVTSEEYFTSFGLFLYTEMHLLRFFMPFQPGLRFSYIPEKQLVDIGFGITVNLAGN
jgi:hypothetical protein